MTNDIEQVLILPATLADWPDIERVYRQGIRTGEATFELESDVPDGVTWFGGKLPGLVFKGVGENGRFLGWVALSPVSRRRAYAGVAEVSVYVETAVRHQGIGQQLLTHIITASENANIWTLQASIFPENIASLRLHLKQGFRIVGIRYKLAQLHGIWRNVLLLERRSHIIY
ncbi:MAG: N-acetyltransferase family protein [Chloroflexi bacterium]|nr:MAG: N-acetyltransferase family protein [Chloroflexota bacterium]